MAFENLLRPGKINRMEVKNRLIAGPIEKAMANLDGTLNERYFHYSAERAKGGVGLMQLESTYVAANGRANPFQVGAHGDHIIPGLRRMADLVHGYGAKLAMELNHAGRQASQTAHHREQIAPSPIHCELLDAGSVPREMTRGDIEEVIGAFVKATERCLEAGVDMIHMHGAHGYLLGQFLSPHTNRRLDEYGGSLPNRARFALEVLGAIRSVVGKDYPIGYRISAVEYVEGGLEIEDSVEFCNLLADAGIDLIDVAGGTYESMAKIFQGPEAPKGGFVGEASVIQASVGDRVPVSVAQRLNDPHFSNSVMEREGFSFISLTRAFHADPHYARKLVENRPAEILPCIGCNTCLDLVVSRVPAACAANPHSAYEATRAIRPAVRPQQVLVVGGGVAGMHAARILARQGHGVTLWEGAGELGGQVRYSRLYLSDHGYLIDWLALQMEKLGVSVELAKTANADDVMKANPDAVVVATGASPGYLWADARNPDIPLFDVFSAMARPTSEWAGDVIVIGGDTPSCQTALHIARSGADIHIIESSGSFAIGNGGTTAMILTQQLHSASNIRLYPERTVELISGSRVLTRSRGITLAFDPSAVVVGGRVSNNNLSESLQRAGLPCPVYTIGDAVRARDIYSASSEAAEVAERIRLSFGPKALAA
jgi:2,4-dienoyl-CoA reductase-like NADH-dependent reductase (Old Yellow Enzyme family)/thioredoxin reductase